MGLLLSTFLTQKLRQHSHRCHPSWQGSSFRVSREMANLLKSWLSLTTCCQSMFLEYEAWNKVQDDGLKYITAVLAFLSLAGNPVMAIGLQFKDRYTFTGNSRDAQAALLFVKDNEYLSSRCFNAGPLWHCHTGWFDRLGADDRVLNQLNIGSGMVDQASTVTIDHRATFHLSTPRQSLEALLHPSGGSRGLREVLDALHDKNKSILRNLLQPEMLAKIGMDL